MSISVASSSCSSKVVQRTHDRRLCSGTTSTIPLMLLALMLWQTASATAGTAAGHWHLRPHQQQPTDLLLTVLKQQFAAGREPVMIVWQKLEQQRLGRLTKLLQGAVPKPPPANPAWAVVTSLLPKIASPLGATLRWYSSIQRPMSAASDLQQFLQAADLDDLQRQFGSIHISSDTSNIGDGGFSEFWSQITEHLSDTALATSMSQPSTVITDSSAAQVTASLPQPTRHRRLTVQAKPVSSDSSSRGTKTTKITTRAMPTGYTTSVSEDFSGISLDSSTSGSSSSNGKAQSVTAAGGGSDVPWPDVTQAADMQRGQIPYRIIGGQEAPLNRFKWACSLRAANDFHYCGCSLIAPSVVLTAAHCLNHPDNEDLSKPWVEVGRYYLAGTNETEGNDYDRIKCVKSVVHDGWSFKTGLNDIALCFLDSSSRFKPVRLAAATNDLAVGQQLTVMGWGAQSEGARNAPQLMEVNVNVVSLQACDAAYQNAVRDTQICAGLPEGGADACQGDSGGPLIVEGNTAADDVQVGIVSYGVGCGRPNTPGVYTDIRKYRGYIKEQLLANGVAYTPLTDKTPIPASATAIPTEAATPVDAATRPATNIAAQPKGACACSIDGMSGNTDVGLIGCKQHGLDVGDTSYYCYAQGGKKCAKATASTAYTGAAWLDCDPQTQQTKKPATEVPSVTATGGKPVTTAPVSASNDAGASQKPAPSNSLMGMALQALQGWMFNAATMPSKSNSTAVRATTTP